MIPSIPGYEIPRKAGCTTALGATERIARRLGDLDKTPAGYTKFAALSAEDSRARSIHRTDGSTCATIAACSAFQHGGRVSGRYQQRRFLRAPVLAPTLSRPSKLAYAGVCSSCIEKGIGGYRLPAQLRPQTMYGGDRGFTGRAGGLLPGSRCPQPCAHRASHDFDGQSEGLTRDDISSTTSRIYLADQTPRFPAAGSIGRTNSALHRRKGVSIPVARERFSGRTLSGPRSWAEKAFPKPSPLQPRWRKAVTSRPGNSRELFALTRLDRPSIPALSVRMERPARRSICARRTYAGGGKCRFELPHRPAREQLRTLAAGSSAKRSGICCSIMARKHRSAACFSPRNGARRPTACRTAYAGCHLCSRLAPSSESGFRMAHFHCSICEQTSAPDPATHDTAWCAPRSSAPPPPRTRRASGSRLSRRPATTGWAALLHQLRFVGLHAARRGRFPDKLGRGVPEEAGPGTIELWFVRGVEQATRRA